MHALGKGDDVGVAGLEEAGRAGVAVEGGDEELDGGMVLLGRRLLTRGHEGSLAKWSLESRDARGARCAPRYLKVAPNGRYLFKTHSDLRRCGCRTKVLSGPRS